MGNKNSTEINKFLNNCEENFFYGYMDMEYSHLSKLSFEQNIDKLVFNIKKSLSL